MRIALFLKNLDEEYQLSIFKGVREEAAKLDLELLCIQGELLPEKYSRLQDIFPSRRLSGAEGILFLASVLIDRLELEYEDQLKTIFNGVPFVSIGDRFFDYPSIQIMVEKPMASLMEHLILFHGYRRLLFIGGPAEHQDSILRERIFRRSVEKYRSRFPALEGEVINGEFLEISGMIVVRDYMRLHPETPPDVIVAANDNMALGVQNMLLSARDPRWRRCPVTGFDDISQSALETPSLTTIHQPLDALGQMAVRTLWDMMRGKKVPQAIHTGAELVIRSSCGCPEPPSAGESAGGECSHAEYRAMANRYHLRYVSILGRALVAVKSYEETIQSLRFFLSCLEVPLFYLVIYGRPRKAPGGEGKLIYERTAEREAAHTGDPPEIDIGELVRRLSLLPGLSRAWCLNHLRSGSEFLGMAIYDAPDDAQPQIYNGLILLANTVKRLFMYGDEMERARELEREVQYRTRDLVEANKKLTEEARRRLEVEAEVLRVSEMERLRFSIDLHDDICQRLAGISMLGKSLASARKDGEGLAELSRLIDETLLRTRQYAHDSFPMELDTLGLRDSLGSLCAAVSGQTHCECRYSWTAGEGSPLSKSQDINVYRIIQEALQNAVKHARANRIVVKISMETAGGESRFAASVQDNGTGNLLLNEEGASWHPPGCREGLGLRSMRYRARQAGAEYFFDSREIGGTLVRILIPLIPQT
ncbi:MAG: substrate-binding domain-containing protein [Treponema sp.]|jgi:signal transduction histidine kinase/DNA-binding LacI/PurR family transcriptional regulator|nr:substrate-binding domain-containing protein [Treponema sp.]